MRPLIDTEHLLVKMPPSALRPLYDPLPFQQSSIDPLRWCENIGVMKDMNERPVNVFPHPGPPPDPR
jgi:hypothetical protein